MKFAFKKPDKAVFGAFLEVYMNVAQKTDWCEKGYNLAWEQFKLDVPISAKSCPEKKKISVSQEGRFVCIKSCGNEYKIDAARGMVSSVKHNGIELLKRESDMVIWRAMTDNDEYVKPMWLSEHFHKTYFKPRRFTVEQNECECLVKFNGALGANGRLPVFDVDISYAVTSCGIEIDINAVKNEELKSMNRTSSEETELDLNLKTEIDQIPRFGMRFALNRNFENLCYFGMGDRENYADYCEHAKMGVWKSTVSDEYEQYIMPQECGNHINTSYLTLDNGDCNIDFSAEKPFEFSALHYTIEELDEKKHSFELCESDSTDVLICYKNRGIGSGSCGPSLSKKYCITDKKIDFSFKMNVDNKNNG